MEVKEGQTTVSGGSFSSRADLAGWPAGDVEVWAAFQTVLGDGAQPPALIERFGSLGERLTGPNVTVAGDIRRVESSAVLPLGQ